MPNTNPLGHFRGLSMIQTNGKVGGYKNVFVNLVGDHNDLVYPHFGGKVMNPPKGRAKMFAGDLLEYRTNAKGEEPEIYILRTFKVVSASGTTVNVENTEFSHKPFVGDILMKAPDTLGGTGTARAVTAVSNSTVGNQKVYALTVTASLGTLSAGDILVEAVEAGTNKAMVVKTINGVFDCDADFAFDENLADINVTRDTDGNITNVTMDDFYKARYQYTPALGGMMFLHKMQPLPQCILDLNDANVNGWFHIDWHKRVNVTASATTTEP